MPIPSQTAHPIARQANALASRTLLSLLTAMSVTQDEDE